MSNKETKHMSNLSFRILALIHDNPIRSVFCDPYKLLRMAGLKHGQKVLEVGCGPLPETAEKFYLPKTLLSVSWTRFGANPVVVSVLVDPDEEKAVEVWSNLGVENKEGEKK